jgi:hypothetical protein
MMEEGSDPPDCEESVMTKFMVLYRSAVSARDQMTSTTPEQAQAGMEAWMAWAAKAGDAIVDLGAPLESAAHVGPGSTAEGAAQVTGFSILQAESADELTALLNEHPHLHMAGSSIDALELIPMPGS